jgi:uncharacterized membrane protein YeaQ/YmgE (transglycosylase-associated protein family)
MGILLIIILGGLAGWIASKLMNRDAEQGILLNIVVGIVGAFLANLILLPLFGIEATLSEFSLEGFVAAIAGSVILLALVNLATRRRLR